MVKICEVVDGCEDCPKYGDDCDGDKMTEHTDLISRADALALFYPDTQYWGDDIDNKLLSLPSADAEPTVIRSKTLMPTKDFKEWAKRIKEENPNVIVIPCDAEVVSADAVSRFHHDMEVKELKRQIKDQAVQGEWIWRTDIPIGDGRTSAGYICSNCGKDYWHGNVFKYCPSCGARMKGGAE